MWILISIYQMLFIAWADDRDPVSRLLTVSFDVLILGGQRKTLHKPAGSGASQHLVRLLALCMLSRPPPFNLFLPLNPKPDISLACFHSSYAQDIPPNQGLFMWLTARLGVDQQNHLLDPRALGIPPSPAPPREAHSQLSLCFWHHLSPLSCICRQQGRL